MFYPCSVDLSDRAKVKRGLVVLSLQLRRRRALPRASR